jgi:hypothetical protein
MQTPEGNSGRDEMTWIMGDKILRITPEHLVIPDPVLKAFITRVTS